MIQGGTDDPRGNHGELLWVVLRFVEHLRENHGESVWVITPIILFLIFSFIFEYFFFFMSLSKPSSTLLLSCYTLTAPHIPPPP